MKSHSLELLAIFYLRLSIISFINYPIKPMIKGIALRTATLQGGNIFTPIDHDALPSLFYCFFNPLFMVMDNYYWCRRIGENFSIPIEWFDDHDEKNDDPRITEITNSVLERKPPKPKTRDDYSEFSALIDTEYIKKFSPYFQDDWDEFFFFEKSKRAKSTPILLKYLSGKLPTSYLDKYIWQYIDGIFYNYDGIRWEFYTPLDNFLLIIIDHLTKQNIYNFTLLDFPGLEALKNHDRIVDL